jgi:hypothetical protein
MSEVFYKEQMLWLQRSRITWLKEGNMNTRFFHQKVIRRARKNKIKKLKYDEGVWKDTPLIWRAWLHPTLNNYLLAILT